VARFLYQLIVLYVKPVMVIGGIARGLWHCTTGAPPHPIFPAFPAIGACPGRSRGAVKDRRFKVIALNE